VLVYRQACQPAKRLAKATRSNLGRAADWQSAIQQVGNLRYSPAARGVLMLQFVRDLNRWENK